MRPLWILVVLLLLAAGGCVDDDPAVQEAPAPSRFAVAPDAVVPGRTYAIDHPGGRLSFAADGDEGRAELVLFRPDDDRAARVVVDHAANLTVPAGEAVFLLTALNGTLTVSAEGAPLPARPLPNHVERAVLAEQEPAVLPLVPALQQPIDLETEAVLQRAPFGMRVLAHGSFQDLRVVVTSPLGVALETETASASLVSFPLGEGFQELPGELFLDNLATKRYAVQVRASHFDGVLVLEAWSFSRARPVEAPAPERTLAFAAYEYGELPDRPAAFDVHPKARQLLFANVGEGTARVALFGPGDERLGVVPVPPGPLVGVALAPGGGSYVAVALSGRVVVGADQAPADLDTLHVLERNAVVVPTTEPGGQGRYGRVEEDVEVPGTLYAVGPGGRPIDPLDPGSYVGCSGGGTTRISQAGETTGFVGLGEDGYANASLYVRDGPVHVVADGFGTACDGRAFWLWFYTRPEA